MLKYNDIVSVMESLAKKRPIFYSEGDFQSALVGELMLQDIVQNYTIIAEYPGVVMSRKIDTSIDIMIVEKTNQGQYAKYSIELKYRQCRLNEIYQEKHPLFELIDQGDRTQQRKMFICKDLKRTEDLYGIDTVGGCTIFLTNDQHYYDPRNVNLFYSISPDQHGIVNLHRIQFFANCCNQKGDCIKHDYQNMKWIDFGPAGFKYLLIDMKTHQL